MSAGSPTVRRDGTGYALVVAAALLLVLNAGVSRAAIRAGVDPTTLTSIRLTGATLVLLAIAVVVRPAALRPPRGRDLAGTVAMGLVGVAALQWTYFVAIDRLPLGIALMLEYTAPVLVAVYARAVLKEPVRRRMWVAIALSLAGLALVGQVWQGLTLDGVGVLAGLGAAVSFAVYFLLGERQVSDRDPLAVILWAFLVAAIVLNVASPVWSVDPAVVGAETSLLGALEDVVLPVWALLGWVVTLGTVAPFLLSLLALRHLRATAVSVAMMLEPVGAAVLGWVWLGETLVGIQVLGAIAVVAAVLLAQTARVAPPVAPPVPAA